MKTTLDDPILTDLYQFRTDHAAAFNNDVSAMIEDLIREQAELEKQGRKFASYPPRRCQTEFPFAPIDEAAPTAAPTTNTSVFQPDSASPAR